MLPIFFLSMLMLQILCYQYLCYQYFMLLVFILPIFNVLSVCVILFVINDCVTNNTCYQLLC